MNRFERQTGRADANEAAIVEALQDRGAIVLVLDRPVDLLVGYQGRWVLVEVKDGPKANIRESQSKFLARCLAETLPCYLIDSIDNLDTFFPREESGHFAGML